MVTWTVYLKTAKRVHFHHMHTKCNFEVADVLTNIIVVVISLDIPLIKSLPFTR